MKQQLDRFTCDGCSDVVTRQYSRNDDSPEGWLRVYLWRVTAGNDYLEGDFCGDCAVKSGLSKKLKTPAERAPVAETAVVGRMRK